MGDNTGIQWTDATWNPVVGCSVTSPGCTNCYAMKMAARIQRMTPGSHYAGTTQSSKAGPVWTGTMVLAPGRILTQPLRWARPRRIFVNSMGDLFHEDMPDAWIDQVFAVMALAPQHTFQVLTKRSAQMRAYCSDPATPGRIARTCVDLWINKVVDAPTLDRQGRWPVQSIGDRDDPDDLTITWPLPNVWLGVSAEDQRRADERVPDLLATPTAVRFVSAEPLLGPIEFYEAWLCYGYLSTPDRPLDQIIVGGESGPVARPMHPAWARSIRDQCAATGTAYFHKQNGEYEVALDRERDDPDWRRDYSNEFADVRPMAWLNLAGGRGFHGEAFHVMRRVGKARAGRLLDGVEHNEMPGVPA